MTESISFDIDYQFIGNSATVQMQLMGILKENQYLIVEDVNHNKDEQTLSLTCSVAEEKAN